MVHEAGAVFYALPIDRARKVLREELIGLELRPDSPIGEASRDARQLLDVPRAQWQPPTTERQKLVQALALTIRRLQGGGLPLSRWQAMGLAKKAAQDLANSKQSREESR